MTDERLADGLTDEQRDLVVEVWDALGRYVAGDATQTDPAMLAEAISGMLQDDAGLVVTMLMDVARLAMATAVEGVPEFVQRFYLETVAQRVARRWLVRSEDLT
jgi:hypothetical protein